jgi:hypothetical protein
VKPVTPKPPTDAEFENSFDAAQADDGIKMTARRVWHGLLNPPPKILARLREAMPRASEDDKQSIVVAHRCLAELVAALPPSEVEAILRATDELERREE